MEDLNPHLSRIRKDYIKRELTEENVAADPLVQFATWMSEAVSLEAEEPNAMHLSTVNEDGEPEGRIVLLRGILSGGFCFYTNYNSRKARSISANPVVSLTFFWHELERQVRVTGRTNKLPEHISDEYFRSRPRASQLGAWASSQSEVIPSREELEEKEKQLILQYKDGEIPRPPFWGGFSVMPYRIEFWQGRASRLHDRILYTNGESGWERCRLSP